MSRPTGECSGGQRARSCILLAKNDEAAKARSASVPSDRGATGQPTCARQLPLMRQTDTVCAVGPTVRGWRLRAISMPQILTPPQRRTPVVEWGVNVRRNVSGRVPSVSGCQGTLHDTLQLVYTGRTMQAIGGCLFCCKCALLGASGQPPCAAASQQRALLRCQYPHITQL